MHNPSHRALNIDLLRTYLIGFVTFGVQIVDTRRSAAPPNRNRPSNIDDRPGIS